MERKEKKHQQAMAAIRIGLACEGIMTQMGNLCYFSSYFMFFIGFPVVKIFCGEGSKTLLLCKRHVSFIKIKYISSFSNTK